jgi:hypothetical protein
MPPPGSRFLVPTDRGPRADRAVPSAFECEVPGGSKGRLVRRDR